MDAEATRLLDNPVWSALTTGNAALAEGGPLAWRYRLDVSRFAAIADRTPESFAALAALVPPADRLALNTIDRLTPCGDLTVELQAPLTQMILAQPIAAPAETPAHLPLGDADISEMLDLTARTKPGPFSSRTIDFGDYIGLRIDGRLAAMAGERMRFGRFVEISAVCVDPDFRGKGYAALLMMRLAARHQARGLTPFLHVFTENRGAIALYEKLGFTKRAELTLTILHSAHDAPAEALPISVPSASGR